MRLPNGRTFLVPPWDPSSGEVYLTNANMDFGVEALFAQLLDSKGVFIDVGAHCGYYSAYVAHTVEKIVAIEPSPKCIEWLKLNTYGIKRDIYNCFAGADQRLAVPYQVTNKGFAYRDDDIYDSRYGHTEIKGSDLPCITIDSVAVSLDVTGIKVDVDGPDVAVLRGALNTIERCQPLITIERTPWPGDDIFKLCSETRYRAYAPIVFAEKKRFAEITSSRRDGWIKMIFLVPQRLWPFFNELAAVEPDAMVPGR